MRFARLRSSSFCFLCFLAASASALLTSSLTMPLNCAADMASSTLRLFPAAAGAASGGPLMAAATIMSSASVHAAVHTIEHRTSHRLMKRRLL